MHKGFLQGLLKVRSEDKLKSHIKTVSSTTAVKSIESKKDISESSAISKSKLEVSKSKYYIQRTPLNRILAVLSHEKRSVKSLLHKPVTELSPFKSIFSSTPDEVINEIEDLVSQLYTIKNRDLEARYRFNFIQYLCLTAQSRKDYKPKEYTMTISQMPKGYYENQYLFYMYHRIFMVCDPSLVDFKKNLFDKMTACIDIIKKNALYSYREPSDFNLFVAGLVKDRGRNSVSAVSFFVSEYINLKDIKTKYMIACDRERQYKTILPVKFKFKELPERKAGDLPKNESMLPKIPSVSNHVEMSS